MAARQQKRLAKEMADMGVDPIPGASIALVHDNIVNWDVTIDGPAGTPFEGGKFVVNIDFSNNYPFKCPVMKFKTKIYHPNVKDGTGEICDQAIKNTWVPTLNANYLIKMLIELIENPNGDSPQEQEIASMMIHNKAMFEQNAREWTEKYAK